jgi:hypothetical protein
MPKYIAKSLDDFEDTGELAALAEKGGFTPPLGCAAIIITVVVFVVEGRASASWAGMNTVPTVANAKADVARIFSKENIVLFFMSYIYTPKSIIMSKIRVY